MLTLAPVLAAPSLARTHVGKPGGDCFCPACRRVARAAAEEDKGKCGAAQTAPSRAAPRPSRSSADAAAIADMLHRAGAGVGERARAAVSRSSPRSASLSPSANRADVKAALARGLRAAAAAFRARL